MSNDECLLVFGNDVGQDGIDAWTRHLDGVGASVRIHYLGTTALITTIGSATEVPMPRGLPEPLQTVISCGDFRLGRRELRPAGTVVNIGGASIGDGSIAVFAGPCAVESREQLLLTARVAASNGAVGLRGGAFKPRTSPYSFQGLRWDGLDLMAEARAVTGLPILTEIVDHRHVERFVGVVDGFQIGARNMQNFTLLSEVGTSGVPVVLKRGFGCTVDELLAAAEYILAAGNDQLVLCERGIRSFENGTRFTLDLAAVPLMKQRSHLPVMVDPSHAVGVRSLVAPMAMAAAAAGADALIIDIHAASEYALCDGKQALCPDEFADLMSKLDLLAMGVGRKLAGWPLAS